MEVNRHLEAAFVGQAAKRICGYANVAMWPSHMKYVFKHKRDAAQLQAVYPAHYLLSIILACL